MEMLQQDETNTSEEDRQLISTAPSIRAGVGVQRVEQPNILPISIILMLCHERDLLKDYCIALTPETERHNTYTLFLLMTTTTHPTTQIPWHS